MRQQGRIPDADVEMIRCDGPCGRELPPSWFHRNGAYRRRTCRDCRGPGPASLLASYRAMADDYRARRIGWDDPGFARVREQVGKVVRDGGPVTFRGVRYGWDYEGDQVSASPARRRGR